MNRFLQTRRTAPGRPFVRLGYVGTLWVLCGLLAGCSSTRRHSAKEESECKPDNIYCESPNLPSDIKRVAILPLGTDESNDDMIAGRDELEPILSDELLKAKRFEIVRPAPKELESRTGRAIWTGEEALPPDFLASLGTMYGCDAVLFCKLTVFRPYGTLAVGWRMKLVEARTGKILWAGDEVFDNGREPTRENARMYQKIQDAPKDRTDGWVVRNSPRSFGQYSLAQLFATLPMP